MVAMHVLHFLKKAQKEIKNQYPAVLNVEELSNMFFFIL